jgi:hypothetical protein
MSQKLVPAEGSPTNLDAPFHPRGSRLKGFPPWSHYIPEKTSNVPLPSKILIPNVLIAQRLTLWSVP